MNRIKEARFKRNLTQIALYKRTGIWASKLSLIENGYIKVSDHEKEKLARALRFKIDWLFLKNE
jgi:transcriptional regulator with XRE-family HTH domain